MKKVKITLTIIVVAAICASVVIGIYKIFIPDIEVKLAENQFIRIIEQEIKQLKAKPDNQFCEDFYKEIAYHIKEYYKPSPTEYPYGRFGKTQSENDQWKENFERDLYTVYAEKFISQAKTVFNGTEWKDEDLKFIQNEKNELKKSKLLEDGSIVDTEFTDIQNTLDKYYEIVNFINECDGYGYSATELSASFPINDVQSKISRTDSLLNNGLENQYVNNCIRLHESLKEIPQKLFRAHVRYLDNKINYWSGVYYNYISYRDYQNNLYKPLKSEIEVLDNDIYNATNFDSEYNRLLEKWSKDNTKAYNYLD